jgi:NAD(P)H-hydrate epimerase
MIPKEIIRQILKPLPKKVHKKQLGRVLAVVGSKQMPGAGLLTVQAVLRTGAGLVTTAYPKCLANVYRKTVAEALHLILPETKAGSLSSRSFVKIQKAADQADVVALGPGLTRNNSTELLVIKLVKNLKQPLIIDADGLNALADLKKVSSLLQNRKRLTIITPHEGEMSRLTGLPIQKIIGQRKKVAIECARRWRSIVVLKGNNTVIATEPGKVLVNQTGGPALATPGSGDVLTGIIATLVAQNLDKPFGAAAVAVYLHGLAGDLAAKDLGERSVISSDIIDYLPKAILKSPK